MRSFRNRAFRLIPNNQLFMKKRSLTSKHLILSAAILSLVITAGAVSYTKASETDDAQQANTSVDERGREGNWGMMFHNRKQMNGAFKEVREAIENGDYQAWADLMNQRPNANELVNEETFSKLQEMYELTQAGDNEGAKKIADELGVQRFGKRGVANQQFAAIREAVETKDYEAWATLVGELPAYEGEINQETFDKHVELHGLMEQANTLREDLNFNGQGMHGGMMDGPMPWRGHGFGPFNR